jgi:hypothetical protein
MTARLYQSLKLKARLLNSVICSFDATYESIRFGGKGQDKGVKIDGPSGKICPFPKIKSQNFSPFLTYHVKF